MDLAMDVEEARVPWHGSGMPASSTPDAVWTIEELITIVDQAEVAPQISASP